MRLPGGRQAQPGVATGQSVLAWRLGYAGVLSQLSRLPHFHGPLCSITF